jgi:signal transduction histidine kinase
MGKATALGQGKLNERVQIKTGDELEQMGNSFNAMADELQRALQLREEFLSVASHEIRTPLTIIKGHAQWLLMRETDERKRRALAIIVKQVDRIVELLNEMLMVSELRAGRMPMERQRVDLGALVGAVVERMQSLAEDHQLLFHREEPVIVDADPDQIEVVVTHLIDNGIRYSAKGSNVEIRVDKTSTEAIFSIKDYGLGIPLQEQAHVFEAFFQMQPGIAGYGGLGLGLFISKEIVERHGGRIWFESTEGQGSTFYFSLPLAQPES